MLKVLNVFNVKLIVLLAQKQFVIHVHHHIKLIKIFVLNAKQIVYNALLINAHRVKLDILLMIQHNNAQNVMIIV